MTESQLVKTIKAHIAAGDKAAQKSNDHYIAAGPSQNAQGGPRRQLVRMGGAAQGKGTH